MPEDLKPYTFIFSEPQRNELHVHGPITAIEFVERLIPRMEKFSPNVEVGLLPPMEELLMRERIAEIDRELREAPPSSDRNTYGTGYADSPRNASDFSENRAPRPYLSGGIKELSDPPRSALPRTAPSPVAPEPSAAANSPSPKKEIPPLKGQTFRCSVENLRAFEKELHRLYGENPTINYDFIDDRESRMIDVAVLAPEDGLLHFAKTLYRMGVLLPKTPQGTGDSAGSAGNSRIELLDDRITISPEDRVHTKKSYSPQKVSLSNIHKNLREALGRKLVQISPKTTAESSARAEEQNAGILLYELRIPHVKNTVNAESEKNSDEQYRKITVELRFDQRNIVLEGEKDICEQVLQLIQLIDKPSSPDIKRRIIQLHDKNAISIQKMARYYAMHRSRFSSGESSVFVPTSRSSDSQNRGGVRQVAFKPQDPGSLSMEGFSEGFDGGSLGDAPAPSAFPGSFEGTMQDYGLGTFPYPEGAGGRGLEVPNLNIQPLPALDIILVEGTKAELDRLKTLITEIETLIEETRSKMVIVHLEHTDCISMNEMIGDIFDYMLYNAKQGRVDLFPLRNPNAILLVGWGAALEEMEELIKTLDTPITQPGSTWKSLRLRYASATYAAQLVGNVFPPLNPYQPGQQRGWAWAPRIRVAVDIRTNSLIVSAGPNDMKEVEQLVRKIDLHHSGPESLLKGFKIRHSLANDISRMLTNLLSPGAAGIGVSRDLKFPQIVLEKLEEGERKLIKSGIISDLKIDTDVQHNYVYITAPEYAMPLIGELIKILDVPLSTVSIKMIPVEHGDARLVQNIIESMFPTQRGQSGPGLPGTEGAEKNIPLRLATDIRTNTIIAAGVPEDLKAVEAVVYQLDQDDSKQKITTVYPLKNAMADLVARALQQFVQQKNTIQRNTPGASSPYLLLEEALVVVPETETNSIVIEAPIQYYEKIIEIVERLDRAPDQVVIQVLIAEVVCNNADEFGAEFGLQDSLLFNRSTFDKSYTKTRTITRDNLDGSRVSITENLPLAAGVGIPGFNFNDPVNSIGNSLNPLSYSDAGTVAPQMLTNFGTGRTGSETGFSGMVFSASSDSVNVMIRALKETRRLDVLSRPQIMAMDNQMAFILVGQRVPRIGGSTDTNVSSKSEIVMEEVGLMLMVTPRISPDGKVVMDIGAEKSSLGSVNDGIPIPDGSGGTVNSPKISAITTRTIVSASNNETVMLGGLITTDKQHVERKVPFISDIPVLGRLFRYELDTLRKEELIIILTPRVIRANTASEDIQRIKRAEAARINWCLNDVVKMHGSPDYDIGIWDPTAEKPVYGPVRPVYPSPTNLDDLELLELLEAPPGFESAPAPRKAPNPFP